MGLEPYREKDAEDQRKVGKVKWAWRPIERRTLRTSRKSKMGLEPYREKDAEDQRK